MQLKSVLLYDFQSRRAAVPTVWIQYSGDSFTQGNVDRYYGAPRLSNQTGSYRSDFLYGVRVAMEQQTDIRESLF